MTSESTSQLPPSGVWFREILEELDAGSDPQAIATHVVTESTMLLPILISHIEWELARAVLAENYSAARRYAELWSWLADPSFARRAAARAGRPATSTASPPPASVERAGAERGNEKDEPRYPGLYL
jgi:hypothetical protein